MIESSTPSIDIADLQTRLRAPLSFSQEHFWIAGQIQPNDPSYNRPVACRLVGPLRVQNLVKALNDIISRHDVLRTTIDLLDGVPLQRIAPSLSISLVPVVVDDLPAADRWPRAFDILKEEARRPFDVSAGPFVRAALIRLDSEEHILLLTMHHAVFDGRSEEILLDELARSYDAAMEGGSLRPDAPRVQYSDFAAWQRERVVGDRFAGRLSYLTEQLRGVPTLLLTHGRRRSSDARIGASYPFDLPPDLLSDLKQVGRSAGATLFMTLLAAFKVLLYRYSGTSDIGVCSPVAGRGRPEFDDVIGCFINTLLLRTDLSGCATFHDLLRRVREVSLRALDSQEVPFEMVVRELGMTPSDGLSAAPILFQLRNYKRRTVTSQYVGIERLELGFGITPSDLALEMREGLDGLNGKFVYDTDLFDEQTIAGMARHYESLLRSAISDPHAAIDDLVMIGRRERERLIVSWNATETAISTKCVQDRIADQARKTPDAPAVSVYGREISYAELLTRADALAGTLRQLGVHLESRVGVVMDRSHEMMVGILAVLRAGGAYVPIDPSYPRERIAYMLEDARPAVVLTDAHRDIELPFEAEVLPSDRWPTASSSPFYSVMVAPSNAAYVIYTSGSSGRPKGVVIEHRSLTNLAQWVSAAYDVGTSDRILQFSSISFDASVEDLVAALCNGACLVLSTEGMANDAETFLRACRDEQITILNLPTGFWHEIVRALDDQTLSFPECVRTVIIGSEAAHPGLLARWHDVVPVGVRLVNEYGPTETTVAATSFDCSAARGTPASTVPIGRPVANTTVYVLGVGMQPVPVGVAGELYIAGAGVARGYLNRPDLTAQRFLPDPFAENPGGRMYRTGDLVRWLPEGRLEFLGRCDRQIKLRGYRIEPAEIESVLIGSKSVREAAVILCRDGERDFLAAYVVPARSAFADFGALRRELERLLPGYMVPATFVPVPALPRLPNGKIDRGALPEPVATASEPAESRPLTETERKLGEIWMDLLGLDAVAPDCGFFESGGHSLLAMRLVARISDRFGVHLMLGTLYERQRLSDVAAAIDRELAESKANSEARLARLLEEIEGLSDVEAARAVRSAL